MIELAAVESTIENEIRQGATQKQVALTYRLAMGSTVVPDWRRINRAIIKRWSVSGLARVKKLAWSGKCFTPSRESLPLGASDGQVK